MAIDPSQICDIKLERDYQFSSGVHSVIFRFCPAPGAKKLAWTVARRDPDDLAKVLTSMGLACGKGHADDPVIVDEAEVRRNLAQVAEKHARGEGERSPVGIKGIGKPAPKVTPTIGAEDVHDVRMRVERNRPTRTLETVSGSTMTVPLSDEWLLHFEYRVKTIPWEHRYVIRADDFQDLLRQAFGIGVAISDHGQPRIQVPAALHAYLAKVAQRDTREDAPEIKVTGGPLAGRQRTYSDQAVEGLNLGDAEYVDPTRSHPQWGIY